MEAVNTETKTGVDGLHKKAQAAFDKFIDDAKAESDKVMEQAQSTDAAMKQTSLSLESEVAKVKATGEEQSTKANEFEQRLRKLSRRLETALSMETSQRVSGFENMQL